jgi:hypothetical protein
MLDARVAKAWIRRMSINARGETEGEGESAGLATGLPGPDTAAFGSAIDVATSWPLSSDFG